MVKTRSGLDTRRFTVWTPKRVNWALRRSPFRKSSRKYVATPKKLRYTPKPYLSPKVNRGRLIRRSFISSPYIKQGANWARKGARVGFRYGGILGRQVLYSRGLGGALAAYWLYRAGRRRYYGKKRR